MRTTTLGHDAAQVAEEAAERPGEYWRLIAKSKRNDADRDRLGVLMDQLGFDANRVAADGELLDRLRTLFIIQARLPARRKESERLALERNKAGHAHLRAGQDYQALIGAAQTANSRVTSSVGVPSNVSAALARHGDSPPDDVMDILREAAVAALKKLPPDEPIDVDSNRSALERVR